MRPIDADELMRKYCGACSIADDMFCLNCKYHEFRVGIKEAPTIEAEPVRHGQWIECDYKYLEHGFMETEPKAGLCCSECRAAFRKKNMTYKQYCGACGARMDGEEERG